ncbi:excinuclease ABC subunit A [Escherichia coli ECC-1470]|nr:excinuclease ABC subunit A [Escherichia coli ECC-1470]
MDKIEVRGARTHNLKNINLVIPRDKLIVVTGLSGSGNPRSLSTPYMPKGSAVTLNPFPPTRGSFCH